MKNIYKIFRTLLAVAILAAVSACTHKDIDEPGTVGLNIKVFFPTKVVAGQPMTINGSGFLEATEIVFPTGVTVTNFEIVSDEMIRVTAPSGISAEGGKLVVRTAKEEVESRLPLTLGSTAVTGYSKQPGEEIEGGQQLTIFGEDLEFISGVELLDADGNPMIVPEEEFYRKGTSNVMVTIPRKNIFTGTFAGKVFTYDGKEFTMPELSYKPESGGGHWEIKKVMMWENGGTVTDPASWNGIYRYALEGHDGNKECVGEIAPENWDKIKTETFYLTIKPAADWYQVRIVTGWWNAQWPQKDDGGAFDFNPNSPEWIDNGDGTFSLPITFGGHEIVGLLDDQHLLFTGSGFTVENLYYETEEWVEPGHWETKITSFWKGDGTTEPANWNGIYRYALEGHDGAGECIGEIAPENWDKIKTEAFYLKIKPSADWFQVRIVTGWWSAQWPAEDGGGAYDFNPNSPEWIDNGDGTFTLPIEFGDHEIVGLLDDQHLLFTGSGFVVLELFQQEEVWVEDDGGGDEPKKEIILWEGEAIADDWGNQPNLLSDAGIELQEAGAKAGQEVRFYITPTDSQWFLEIVEGHWGGTYASFCSPGANDGARIEWDLDANGGYVPLTLTQEMLDVAYVQQWWGGTFIGNGDNVKITKITLY